jgi:DNA topoisomerase-2
MASIEDKYQKKSHHAHILDIPETYINSIIKDVSNMWVYNRDTKKLEKKDIEFVPGLYKIVDEALVNARDHSVRTDTCRTIKVDINKEEGSISVWNDGDGIDIAMHNEHKVYVPELIFGHLLTSTNYDKKEKKIVGGKNGYGAKLTNIFSTEFTIETVDTKTMKKYTQTFRDNMYTIGEPIIKKVKEKEKGYTKITFKPDYKRFSMDNITDDMISVIEKRIFDIAACTPVSVKVYLNNVLIDLKGFDKYVDYFFPDYDNENSEADDNASVASGAQSLKQCKIYEAVNERWRIAVVFNPEYGGECISYVNGICTYKGGTHVDYIYNQLIKNIQTMLLKKNKNIKLKPSQIKDNITLFIDSVIENPSFSSQTKEELTSKRDTFGSVCELSEAFYKKLGKTGLINELLEFGKLKDQSILKKTDGKKSGSVIGVDKLEDANKAGSANWRKCKLILTEGDSAKALAVAGLSVIGRDYYGVFPLKGKLLNVREATSDQMLKNEEITSLKKIMGFQHGLDYKKENTKLRYGGILIFTDQDVDGSHIKGLLINFIHTFWPSLLKTEGFITCLTTPVIKVSKGNQILDFYNLSEYDKWAASAKAKGWSKPKYYKGLGTSTAKEAREYFADFEQKLITYQWTDEYLHNKKIVVEEDKQNNQDDQDDPEESEEYDKNEKFNKCYDAITLAFAKKRADDRKKWLSKYDSDQFLENKDKLVSYSEFVHKELIHFSNDDNNRSLPSLVDGFKPSQRKIYYVSEMKKLHNQKNEIKVAQLAGAVSEKANYHHGEASLCGAIVNMAQNYVGSNNINIMMPNGQFGTRLIGGKDSASVRYIFTRFVSIAQKIFRSEDLPILQRVVDDGEVVEPVWYIPVIPMVLVNGTDGIGTGFSSQIPCYNPIDIVNNIFHKLNNEEQVPMVPWYRNFKGHIIKISSTKYEIRGVYKRVGGNKLEISELPIGTWTTPYKNFLEKITIGNNVEAAGKKKEIIQQVENYCSEVAVKFIVEFPEGVLDDYINKGILEKKLKLVTTKSISNMHLHNRDGTEIKRYKNTDEIINDFSVIRLEYYQKRKDYYLAKYQMELDLISWKRLFIKYVIEGTIVVFKQKKSVIYQALEKHGFPKMEKNVMQEVDSAEASASPQVGAGQTYDYLLDIKISKFTQEELDKLDNDLKQKEDLIKTLKGKTPNDMWREELNEFVEVYKIWDNEQTIEFNNNAKTVIKNKEIVATKIKKAKK